MGLVKEHLFDAEYDAWEASPEGRVEREKLAGERDAAAAAQVRREADWAARHPAEWKEWVRVQLLLNISFDFAADNTFDFDDFLKEVGHRPSAKHIITRLDQRKPYQQRNLGWRKKSAKMPKGDYLTCKQAEAEFGITKSALYRLKDQNLVMWTKPPGSRYLFSRDSLRQLLRDNGCVPRARAMMSKSCPAPSRARKASTPPGPGFRFLK